MPPFRSTGSKSPPQRLTAKCWLQWCCGSAKISCNQDYPSPLLCVMSMVATSCAPAGTGPDGKHTVWKCDSGNSDDNEFFSAQIPPDPPLASTVSSSYAGAPPGTQTFTGGVSTRALKVLCPLRATPVENARSIVSKPPLEAGAGITKRRQSGPRMWVVASHKRSRHPSG
jgi:hypothetical protein